MRTLGVAAGVRYLVMGQAWVLRRRRWLGLGLLPALVTLVIYAAALVVLALTVGDLAEWLTPFADGWGSPWQSLLRTPVALVLLGGGLLLAVLTFTAVALLLGEPFYDRLSQQVEATEGGGPPAPPVPGPSPWQAVRGSLYDSGYVLSRAALLTTPLFLLGFVPVVGQTVAPALGFAVSGFFLSLELTSFAMERRDVPVRERLRLLRRHLGTAIGFGVPLALLFLVPLAAVFLMPGAVAGATLLARDLAPGGGEEQR